MQDDHEAGKEIRYEYTIDHVTSLEAMHNAITVLCIVETPRKRKQEGRVFFWEGT
jgi:hypothetical protein